MAYGLSFQPGAQNTAGPRGTEDSRVTPAQEAIKLLSLRLPTVVGARALAPNALMQSPGSAGLSGPGGMSVDAMIEWLRRQMQQSGAQAPPQTQSMLQPPQSRGPFQTPGGYQAPSGQGPVSRPLPQPDRPDMWPYVGGTQEPFAAAPPRSPRSAPPPPRAGAGGIAGVVPEGIAEGPRSSGMDSLTPPEPPEPINPWAEAGRNETMANKYLDEYDRG